MNKALMLDRIKDYYSFKTDVDFAKFLGITPQVYSNWKGRNSFDAELLFNKCPELNSSWLLCGKEPMISDERKELQVNEAKSPYILRKKLTYLEDELRVLTQAAKIMSESGNQIKKAIELLSDQLQLTENELKNVLKEKK
ncbi:helix-turn-helix domain-containing protein [Aequorivita viscosa]|nr:helix-turn-helix domain-containing protein [Aequorivita viscosa]